MNNSTQHTILITAVLTSLLVHLIYFGLMLHTWHTKPPTSNIQNNPTSHLATPIGTGHQAPVVFYKKPLKNQTKQKPNPLHTTLPAHSATPTMAPTTTPEQQLDQKPIPQETVDSPQPSLSTMPHTKKPQRIETAYIPNSTHSYQRTQQQQPAQRLKTTGLSLSSIVKKHTQPKMQTTQQPGSGSSSLFFDPLAHYCDTIATMIAHTCNVNDTHIMFNKSFVKNVIIAITINKQGTLVDLHVTPNNTPDLKNFESILYKTAVSTGFFPKIPNALNKEKITINLKVNVNANKGYGKYVIT